MFMVTVQEQLEVQLLSTKLQHQDLLYYQDMRSKRQNHDKETEELDNSHYIQMSSDFWQTFYASAETVGAHFPVFPRYTKMWMTLQLKLNHSFTWTQLQRRLKFSPFKRYSDKVRAIRKEGWAPYTLLVSPFLFFFYFWFNLCFFSPQG